MRLKWQMDDALPWSFSAVSEADGREFQVFLGLIDSGSNSKSETVRSLPKRCVLGQEADEVARFFVPFR